MRALLGLNRRAVYLYLEAFLYLGAARLKLLRPFAKLAPSLGIRADVTGEHCEDTVLRRELKAISTALDVMSRYTFWESKCLVRAIAGMKMLEKRGISSTLYLGTGKDKQGKLIAHAWLRSGPIYLSGASEMKNFVVVETFANRAV
ncbi:lasso peptide biosynthesis B2 protein [Paenibacillus sp. GCM10027627]|uniref:lasso peptide biosynthesis B2 protein n=1 Tax=unclassified Paenibacillus TaxID=185978 RepID=UPI003641EF6B